MPPATASSAHDNPDRQEVFGTLACAERIWAVAAVHGEADRLRQLHDQLEARFAHGDRLVYLGNYLGHGDRIAATLDELIDFRRHLLCRSGMEPGDIVFLRGAQEYEAKINSGDPVSIAEVVRDLHRNAGQPEQSYSERQIYEAALDRLARELAAVERIDEEQATQRLEKVLRAA